MSNVFVLVWSLLVACTPIRITKDRDALQRAMNSHLNFPFLQNFNNENDLPPSTCWSTNNCIQGIMESNVDVWVTNVRTQFGGQTTTRHTVAWSVCSQEDCEQVWPTGRSNYYCNFEVQMSIRDILRYLQQLPCDMTMSVISIGNKLTGIVNTAVVCCLHS